MRAKNLKFYVEILKKGGHWVWTVVKNGVIGCKTCEKKGVIIQADDIGRHMGVPPPPGFYANLGDAGTRLPARK